MSKFKNAVNITLFTMGVAGLFVDFYSRSKKAHLRNEHDDVSNWFTIQRHQIDLLEIQACLSGQGPAKLVENLAGVKNIIAYESIDRFPGSPDAAGALTNLNDYIDEIIKRYQGV
ncbi:hypothetical protein ST201phi2-1p390 [Pseudomonas phage 201phi2-1]|uniref:Uncharacterized protein n=1 Tax=Pseudomonas phage 201phi2-1 TaxID=198110 RepID=B3FJQ0_BP201|nr:hypothetical protein ST201phi2-1p390 [Pseudomonas phage 201phi2-1]ABY63215.1 hypothetical protein 201phi2-1p390 [Pseudomonas phage 201phi2-1]